MAIKISKITLEIVNGPSKSRLFDSCEHAYGNDEIRIDITSKNKNTYPVVITGIKHADNSDRILIIEGYIAPYSNLKTRPSNAKIIGNPSSPGTKFNGVYDVLQRTGTINFDFGWVTGGTSITEEDLDRIEKWDAAF